MFEFLTPDLATYVAQTYTAVALVPFAVGAIYLFAFRHF